MANNVEHFSLRISKHAVKEDISRLLIQVYQWPIADIEQQPFEGGLINTMVHCWNKKTPDQEKVVIRVWSDDCQFTDGDHTTELACVKVLSDKGCFPKLRAIFENGYCYRFYQGSSLTKYTDFVEDQRLINAFTKGLALIHATEIPSLDRTVTIHNAMEKMFLGISDESWNKFRRNLPNFPAKENFSQMMALTENLAKHSGSPIVLCHGDAHFGNALWNFVDDHVMFVDCELTNYNYQGFDIAYHFYSYHFEELYGKIIAAKDEDQYNRLWLKIYLTNWFRETKRDESEVTNEDVERVLTQANKCALLVYLWIILISLKFSATGVPGLDLCKIAAQSFDRYQDNQRRYHFLKEC